MSIGSVNAFIKELEACGLIEITRRGQGKTNLYTINFVVKTQSHRSLDFSRLKSRFQPASNLEFSRLNSLIIRICI